MDTITTRLKCLELASETLPQPDPAKIVEAAEAYWRWATDQAPCPSPPSSTDDRS